MADDYHHGDLRAAALREVAAVVDRAGVEGVTLRGIAAALGVTHTAPRHHFGSREGLLAAFAAQGYRMLAEALAPPAAAAVDLGVRYVRFAQEHPAHFRVMTDADVLRGADPELVAAKAAALAPLRDAVERYAAVADRGQATLAVVAAWSLMHGLVALEMSGLLEAAGLREELGDAALPDIAGQVGLMLNGSGAEGGS